MKILRACDFKRMPWRNGGGLTTEIAIWPTDAGLDTFDWRVSMAHVDTDGPFSMFPGIDRTLAIIDGGGLRLELEGRAPVELTSSSDPFFFPADVPTLATLVHGPVVDLNVMTRRGRMVHRVEALVLGRDEPRCVTRAALLPVPARAVTTVLFCTGNLSVSDRSTTRSVSIQRHNVAVLEGDATVDVVAAEPCRLLRITLFSEIPAPFA